MVRRCLPLMLALLLVLAAPAALAHSLVTDDAGLYTPEETEEMEGLISELIDRFQMDIGVLTTRDVPYASGDDSVTVAWADAYYEDNGFGLGEDRAGVLFILDMTNRYNYLSTAGTMADYLNDHRIEEILESADEALYSGDYGEAMLSQLRVLGKFLRAGIEEGSFRYDEQTGQRLTGLYNRLTLSEGLLAAGGGIALGLFIALCVSSSYLLKGKTYRYHLNDDNVHVRFTRDEETFLRERVTRTDISSGSGSRGGGGGGGRGSGMHTSSGGMSHGGGGHHF